MRQGSTQIDARLRQLINEVSKVYREYAFMGTIGTEEFVSSIRQCVNGEEVTRENAIDAICFSLALVSHLDHEAELEFHRQRRMFYILGDAMRIGEEGDERSHSQWMQDEGDYDSFTEAIRGYADRTGLYAYKGTDFFLTSGEESDFFDHLPRLVLELNLDADLEIWSGVKPGPIGVRWEGRKKMGKVRELMRW